MSTIGRAARLESSMRWGIERSLCMMMPARWLQTIDALGNRTSYEYDEYAGASPSWTLWGTGRRSNTTRTGARPH